MSSHLSTSIWVATRQAIQHSTAGVIQIPENERDQIRKTINSKIPNHKFIVFDEEVYELHGQISNSTENVGWHLNAIHLKQGWTYTKGSSDVKVAIVDDGIQAYPAKKAASLAPIEAIRYE